MTCGAMRGCFIRFFTAVYSKTALKIYMLIYFVTKVIDCAVDSVNNQNNQQEGKEQREEAANLLLPGIVTVACACALLLEAPLLLYPLLMATLYEMGKAIARLIAILHFHSMPNSLFDPDHDKPREEGEKEWEGGATSVIKIIFAGTRKGAATNYELFVALETFRATLFTIAIMIIFVNWKTMDDRNNENNRPVGLYGYGGLIHVGPVVREYHPDLVGPRLAQSPPSYSTIIRDPNPRILEAVPMKEEGEKEETPPPTYSTVEKGQDWALPPPYRPVLSPSPCRSSSTPSTAFPATAAFLSKRNSP